ncbi:hypothetical protein B4U79_17276 [Dinothrombium tinctorium]|uniref:Caspase family p20 domain-containing protein n=1 Tax=Dinothrombium tinctorium TaxID=1965070 RepID=A0A443RHA7_9ACAR|nr:hypothetical protein B4U79_17276 [Dinothrombium tinctorium]
MSADAATAAATKRKCLIIWNNEFKDKKPNVDFDYGAEKFSLTFKKLEFDVCDQNTKNLTLDELIALVQEKRRQAAEVFVLIFLTRGNGQAFLCSDNKAIAVSYFLDQFNNKYCPGLKAKPKFFIFLNDSSDQEDISRLAVKMEDDSTKIRTYESIITFTCCFKNNEQANLCCDVLCKTFANDANDEDIEEMTRRCVSKLMDKQLIPIVNMIGYSKRFHLRIP